MPGTSNRRTFLRSGVAGALSGFAWLGGCSQQPSLFAGYALVVIRDSAQVAVVDLAAFTLTSKLEFPDPVAQLLYREETRSVYGLSTEPGRLHELNWASRSVFRSLQLGLEAREARMDPNGPSIWVSLSSPPSLVRVSLEDVRVQVRIPLPAPPISFDVSPYQAHIAASLDGGGLALVSDTGNPTVRLLRMDEQFGPLQFRSDGRQLIAANHSGMSLSIVRASDSVPVVDLPIAIAARYLCSKPDGGLLFATDGERDGVAIVYPYATEVDRSVLAGSSPGAMYACASPPYLLVANRLSSDITILDLTTGRLVAIVPVGASPGFVTATPDQQYALALNEGSGDMAVIRLANVRSRRNKTAPLFTMVPVGVSPQSLIVVES